MAEMRIVLSVTGVGQAVADINRVKRALNSLSGAGPNFQGGGGGGGGGGGLGGAGGALASLAAEAAEAVPEIAAVVSVIEVLKSSFDLLVRAVRETISVLTELTNAAQVSGGTRGNIAALSAFGIDPGQIAGRAAALRERIVNDPFARVAAAQIGVSPGAMLRRSVGPQNEAQFLQQTFEGLRKITNAEERLRQARMLGVDDMMSLINVSQEMAARQAATAQRLGDAWQNALGPDAETKINDFWAALHDLIQNIQVALIQTFGPYLPILTQFLKNARDAIVALIPTVQEWIERVINLYRIFLILTGHGAEAKQLGIELAKMHAEAAKTQKDAAAMQMKAAGATAMNPGLFGGGPRFQGAFPVNMIPNPNNMDIWSFRFGAFGY